MGAARSKLHVILGAHLVTNGCCDSLHKVLVKCGSQAQGLWEDGATPLEGAKVRSSVQALCMSSMNPLGWAAQPLGGLTQARVLQQDCRHSHANCTSQMRSTRFMTSAPCHQLNGDTPRR